MVYRVVKVFPLVKREYTSRDGAQQVWLSKGFLLTDGRSSVYAEAQQATADALELLCYKGGEVVQAHLRLIAREYESNGVKRYSNEVCIDAMMIISKK